MNELENRRLMLQFKNNIDMKMYGFLKYDLELTMREHEEVFSFYNKSKDKCHSQQIDLQFNVYYEDYVDVYNRKIKQIDENSLTEEEFYKIAEEISNNAKKESDLNYVVIDCLKINPRYNGIGSKLMEVFIEEVNKIKKIQYIFLGAKNDEARRFWEKFGFEEYTHCNKNIKLCLYNAMVLDLKL